MIREIRVENFKGIASESKISFVANTKRVKSKNGIHKTATGEILLVGGIMGEEGSRKTLLLEAIDFVWDLALGDLYDAKYKKLKEGNKTNKQIKNGVAFEDVANSIRQEYFSNKAKKLKIGITFVDKANTVDWNVALSSSGTVTEVVDYYKKQRLENTAPVNKFKTKLLDKEIGLKISNFFSHKRFRMIGKAEIEENIPQKVKLPKADFLAWVKLSNEQIVDLTYDSKNQQIKECVFKQGRKKSKLAWSFLPTLTQEWILFGNVIFKAFLDEQCFIFIEEIEDTYRPSIAQFIINLFTKKTLNKKHSQLFFTSYTPNVVPKHLRKDAINYFENKQIINFGSDLKIGKNATTIANFLNKKLKSPSKQKNFIDIFKDFL